MGMQLATSGFHHIGLRVTDLERAKHFYTQTLGFSNIVFEVPGVLFLFMAGSSMVGVLGPNAQTEATDRFSPFRVGMDHVALTCPSEAELERAAIALRAEGIEVIGPKADVLGTARFPYLAFRDPDGIKWEYYCNPA